MSDKTIAVLLTSFNRKNLTIKCLKSLFDINKNLAVYLLDDNSTDGTKEAVKLMFPNVIILSGSGDLFWNRGMYTAWDLAKEKDYDYYIWLNDDVRLFSNAFQEIFECSNYKDDNAIIVGAIQEESSEEVIYGGRDKNGTLIFPNGELNEVKNVNGNFVLIPRSVYKIIGNLDYRYNHALGDVDYGYRALKEGFKIYTTKCFIGFGEKNPISRVRLNNANFVQRFRKLYSPLGLNPFEQYYFRKKHFNIFNAISYFVYLHFLNIILFCI